MTVVASAPCFVVQFISVTKTVETTLMTISAEQQNHFQAHIHSRYGAPAGH